MWQFPRASSDVVSPPFRCCRSSVVEHSLGKGEVDSSILSCSTSPTPDNCRMFGTDTGAHLRCSASPGLDRQRTSPNCRHATDTLGREVVTGRPARSAPPQSKPTTARKREETSRRRMLTDRCMTAGGEVRFRMGCWTLMIFGGPAKKSDPGDQTKRQGERVCRLMRVAMWFPIRRSRSRFRLNLPHEPIPGHSGSD